MRAPNDDTLDLAGAHHVLGRVGFGASPERAAQATRDGLEATLAELESRDAHDAHLVGDALRPLLATGDLTALQARWMALILGDGAPLIERVTLMWHDHFATSNAKVGDVALMHAQNETLRTHGLGDFRALLHAMATDAAMLVWLDGNQNRVGAPNENFAREVMELFGLGIGNGYTEADIREAARAFSGWTVKGRRAAFVPARFDGGEKSLFGEGSVVTHTDAIDRVLAHPACPRWIARTLLAAFVHESPPEALVGHWAAVLVEEDWHVGRTLGRLFRDPVFLSPYARRSRIAGPVELVARTVLTTGAEVTPLDAVRAAGVMGQTLFLPPSVKGWDGGRAWIDPGTWLARHNWATEFALAKGLDGKAAFGDVRRAEAVDAVTRVLLPDGAGDSMRPALEAAARSAHSDGHALHKVAALVLTSPEYQLT